MEGKVTAKMEIITPKTARVILQGNTVNRKVRDKRVKAYADDMKNGRWAFNGEAIVIDENGVLRDGQHRLLAVIEADIAVRMMVVRGVAEEEAKWYDGGMVRQTADELKRSTTEIAIARFLIYNATGKIRGQVSSAAVKEFIEAHNESITFAAKQKSSGEKVICNAAVLAAIAAAYESGYSTDKLERFSKVLRTGESVSAVETCIIKTRKKLLTTTSSSTGNGYRLMLYYITQHGLRAYENGKNIARFPNERVDYYKIT